MRVRSTPRESQKARLRGLTLCGRPLKRMGDWLGARPAGSQSQIMMDSAAHGSELGLSLYSKKSPSKGFALERGVPPAQQVLILVCAGEPLTCPEPRNAMNSLRVVLSKNSGLNSVLRGEYQNSSNKTSNNFVNWWREFSENPLKKRSGYVWGAKKGSTAGNGPPPRDGVREVWQRTILREKRRMSKC